ncbi:MAG: hypothetical protein Kow00117_17680 [Phototrophicales bacterium]
MSAKRTTKGTATVPFFWSVLLIIIGILLLLDNFLLLGDFNAYTLVPLLLVVAGAQILLRGDLFPSEDARTFGITRGSVESATLEISSGEIDVDVRALGREGRLIAGQFAAGSRPDLTVKDTYTHIKMSRSNTPWLSFADWHVGLAHDLPWQLLISSSLGQLNLDLKMLIIHDALIASGIGDIRLVAPKEAFRPLIIRSTMGNIQINTPQGYRTRIVVEGGRLFGIKHDEYRYENPEPNVYFSTEAAEDAPLVEIHVSGTFGDVYLV